MHIQRQTFYASSDNFLTCQYQMNINILAMKFRLLGIDVAGFTFHCVKENCLALNLIFSCGQRFRVVSLDGL